MGIEESKQEAVFSKYYRLDNVQKESGIGLYLVKELLTNARGRIQLESQLGKGTQISIFLKSV